MRNLIVGLLILGAFLVGCENLVKEGEVIQMVEKKPEVVTQEELRTAQTQLKQHLEFNYQGTTWYNKIQSFGVIHDPREGVVVGIVVNAADAYKEMVMPLTLWITSEAPIEVDKVWFLYDGELVHFIAW